MSIGSYQMSSGSESWLMTVWCLTEMLVCPFAADLVVTRITPLAPRDPSIADPEASLRISIDSMSETLMPAGLNAPNSPALVCSMQRNLAASTA